MNSFQDTLLTWYEKNRRAMPWRGTRDAYRIWLSEVMLQQTRVAAVVGYYRRFVRRFPTARALARASQNEVLKHWAGLGYYSRARNLHRAAKEIVAKHGGRFPRTLEAALALAGVGRYTAAAVLSIAYGQPHAVLDGNVARVLARLYAIRGELRAPRRWKELQLRADALLAAPHKGAQATSLCYNPGDWNQAMMELGATVCTPRAPQCDACPIARWCRARKLAIVDELPATRRKREPVRMAVAAAVLLDPRGRTLLIKPERSATNGLFSHMWQFPTVEGARDAQRKLVKLVQGAKVKSVTQRTRRAAESTEKPTGPVALKPAKHSVTFREITLQPYLLRVASLPRISGARTPRLENVGADLQIGPPSGLKTRPYSPPISNATRKIAQRALEFLARGDARQVTTN